MTAFGTILKELRQQNRLSQMTLSLDAEVSARHISFMETGRSKPSREMVLHLSSVMNIPSKDTNLLLTSAGYSQEFTQNNLYDESMNDVREALSFMMEAHEPFPAVVIDRSWNLLMVNSAQVALTQYFVKHGANFPNTTNLMELFFHPNGYRTFVNNWEHVAIFLLRRLYHEQLASPAETNTGASSLLDTILEMPNIPGDWKTRPIDFGRAPMVKIEASIGGIELSLFSSISSFGTALDVTLQDLRIEHYFPGNSETKSFLIALAKGEVPCTT